MAEMIIQNPSITPNVFEYDEVGRVSAISGHPLAGEGGGTIVKSDLMWKPTVGDDGYVSWTLASSATQPAPAYISGAQGPAGPQGVSGNPGKNPEFRINPSNAEWQWKYSGDEGWTDLGVVASGAVGPQGLSGNSGKDGISPTVSTSAIPGGNRVTFTYGEGSSTYIDVMSGASGANGKDGISPTVSTETITGGNRVTFTYGEGSTESIDVMSGASGANGSDGFSPVVTITDAPTAAQHPQGGKTVTITDAAHPGGQSFDIWNGINGEGATVNLLDGNGIHITNDGTNYTIAVSADYAAKSYVDSASANALSEAKTWVGNQHYLTSVPDTYALKSDVPTTVAELTDSNDYAKKTDIPTVPTKVTDLTDSANYQTVAGMTDYLLTATYAADSGKFVTSGSEISAANEQYALTTNGWAKIVTPATFTGVTTTGSISGGGVNNDTIGLLTSAENALTAVDNKVTKPDTTQTVLNNNYLIYSTLTGEGATTGWMPLSTNYYSKSEANGTFVATANIDTTTLSGDGKSVSTKLGVKTDVIATKDYVNSSFLPLTGGTVSGELIVSAATGTFDNSYIKCVNDGNDGYSRFGVGSQGGAIIKTVDGNNNSVQVNVNAGSNNSQLINVKTNNGTTNVGYLIPAMVEQAGWTPSTDDKILHIVLES